MYKSCYNLFMKKMENNSDNMTLQTVDRALSVLEMIAEKPVTQKQLEAQTGFNRTTMSRLLNTLRARQYIQKNEATGQYKIGIKVVEIGSVRLNQIELKTEALPYLRELSANLGRVCHMGILSQGEVVYIEKIEPMTTIRMFSGIGKRVPVHSTSLGKALLIGMEDSKILSLIKERSLNKFTNNTITDEKDFIAEMAMVRRQGYAIDNAENENGIYCVAAPIKDYRGKVIAAISTTGSDDSFVMDRDSEIIKSVTDTARKISQDIGGVSI